MTKFGLNLIFAGHNRVVFANMLNTRQNAFDRLAEYDLPFFAG